ncbi:MAG: response regulator [Armatimonadetes bacterium]|nr:MAG: response regulator [Armatimonadota bacterium]
MKRLNPGWLKRSLRISLGLKLLIASSLTAALAIGTTLFIVGTALVKNARAELDRSTASLATTLASSLEAPLAFHAEDEVKQTLQMFSQAASVRAIAVYDPAGRLLASVGATGVFPERITDVREEARTGAVQAAVSLQGDSLGKVYVVPNDDRITSLQGTLVNLGFLVGALALMLSAFLAVPLIRHITTNIRLLSSAAERVASGKGLDVKVQRRGNDETGDLVERFNHMVQELHAREEELRRINQELEDRVAARTAELEEEVAARREAQDALESRSVFLQLLNETHQLVYKAESEEQAAQSIAEAMRQAFGATVALVECYEVVSGHSTWKGGSGISGPVGLSCPAEATPAAVVRRTLRGVALRGHELALADCVPCRDEIPLETYVGAPLLNAKGECIGALSLFFDERLDDSQCEDLVSSLEMLATHAMAEVERRRQEAEIAFLARFPEENPSPVLRCSSQGVVLYANPASRPFLADWHAEEGAPLPEEVAKICQSAYAAGKRRQKEIRLGEGDYLFTFAPVEGSGYVHVYATDVSTLKEAERQIAEARDRALEVARLKSEFLANMSHEIRTPMNGVLGMAELLLATKLSDEQREFVETIHNSGQALLAILNDILDFSKIEAGRMSIHEAPTVPCRIAEEVAGLLSATASAKGIEIVVSRDTDLGYTVMGDEVRLRQVLTNLVGNAVKFTDEGEVVVRVMTRSQNDERVRLRFEVSDTGPGIPEDQLDLIFDPFRQADGSMTRKYGGTGLGLSISRQLVELMGGTMGVTSTVGEGSTFWFEVEFERVQGAAASFTAAPEELQEKNILIVDDNATNRLILARSVDSWGMIPTTASGGEEALRLLKSDDTNYDAIIVDGQMPEMCGAELARHIRELDAHRSTPLVLLSSAGSLLVTEEDGQLFDFVLSKPIRRSQLFNVLANTFGFRMVKETTPAQAPTECRCCGRILLAEDNVVNRKVAVRLLEKMGHTVLCAEDGRQAVEIAKQEPIDLILMDVQMPEMDGFEATAAIRDWQIQSGITFPIIAMTAHALEGDRERCIAAGMDDYISKPISRERLERVLSRWLTDDKEEAA